MRTFLSSTCCVLLSLCATTTRFDEQNTASDPAGIEFFETHVRPILSDHCFGCHSAQAEKIKGGLRLDARDLILKGGDSGPALVVGSPDQSLLIKAVRYAD